MPIRSDVRPRPLVAAGTAGPPPSAQRFQVLVMCRAVHGMGRTDGRRDDDEREEHRGGVGVVILLPSPLMTLPLKAGRAAPCQLALTAGDNAWASAAECR